MTSLLFVDDDVSLVAGLQRTVRRYRPDWVTAGVHSAQEASRHLPGDIDVIISDINMPEMDGLGLLEKIKTEPTTAHIPVIMLTGAADQSIFERALELGAHDFIAKPADPVELIARIRAASRLKDYEDQLRTQNVVLERQVVQAQRMEVIGGLAGGIAHDLNNMLGIITGHAEMAARHAADSILVQRCLDRIMASAGHMAQLMRQILVLGRKPEPERLRSDLPEVIDGCIDLLSVSVPPTIQIVWERPDFAEAVLFNQTQIYQFLLNLCKNAVDAMHGSGVLQIRLEEAVVADFLHVYSGRVPAGHYAKITVADTGQGIPSEQLSQIFKPYFTTKEPGRGTGVGLFVVDRIVQQLKGFIDVTSRPSQGTTFAVYLPYIDEADAEELRSNRGMTNGEVPYSVRR